MDYKNIKIEYQDTPEKFRATAYEVISYLVENLLVLNSIEECSQLDEYLKKPSVGEKSILARSV